MKQILFAIALFITLGVFSWTVMKLIALFRLTKSAFPVKNIGKRIMITLEVAIGQSKIMRKPVVGLMHALVWWGFLIILVGSIEMVIDGLTGTERSLGILGLIYNLIIASGDIFAFLIAILIILFLGRRFFLNIKRFSGIEMKHKFHIDAYISLSIISFPDGYPVGNECFLHIEFES